MGTRAGPGLQALGQSPQKWKSCCELKRRSIRPTGPQGLNHFLSVAHAAAAEMIEAAGVKNVQRAGRMSVPGFCIHEVGMGNDRATSVVNKYCQAHDVPSIFVTGGACWVS